MGWPRVSVGTCYGGALAAALWLMGLGGLAAASPESAPPDDPNRKTQPTAKRPAARAKSPPRTLETDPIDLLPMAMRRGAYLWPLSPRLRSGAWVAVHYFVERSRTFQRYDPELVYSKADSHFVSQVGGSLRLGAMEISLNLPFAGLSAAEYYEKGVVDRVVRKLDRADMNLGFKYGFRIKRERDLWLITPYVTVTAPTQKREAYEVNLGGHIVQHHTAPPRGLSVLSGLAVGWRRNMWSAVISLGGLVTVSLEPRSELDPSEGPPALEVGLLTAYQLGFAPFRDLAFTLGLLHLRTFHPPSKDQEDFVWAALGLRLQPYAGLYGHLGVMAPLARGFEERPPVMVTLQAGWEFR